MSENSLANSSKLLVVLTSLPNLEVATALARALVERNFAACVQLTEGIQSIYRWKGKVCEEHEVLLSAKTIASKWLEISSFIQEQHPYDLPEILAFSPEQYEKQYGKWVQSEVNSKS
ncbi:MULTISPECIES: divalent-cation tolerance protein CutA [unclassified Polynucleobacter]|jgi:periplasmic divalent cation tolerance protein|uniref:divalent-cation tolerance protein CutA n=1 Tax=unclassified Polynucleobacter TaxID=2640945 RepID=UPI001BFEA621|nr:MULTISPECIES: divalent-cation tolerance protein CutA [unclassified Polynucleobacter]MBU3627403.1 divalent-cation tolerance protein CutA [Polynucleobacter sp. AP-Reno-20A-A9]MBU3638291.1 divalent-cation tolerance protein CutA [Polynucleobacter sp. AP-RePozz3-80-G7]QWD81696.1 divalent-cation tolerance protein CutA [Polynucleobacter sp. MWH-S4W17]